MSGAVEEQTDMFVARIVITIANEPPTIGSPFSSFPGSDVQYTYPNASLSNIQDNTEDTYKLPTTQSILPIGRLEGTLPGEDTFDSFLNLKFTIIEQPRNW